MLLYDRKEVVGMCTEMKREMTVEGGVMAGVDPKDKCEMSAKRGAVAGVEAGIE